MTTLLHPEIVERRGVKLFFGDSLALYPQWDAPTVIMSDGAYGVAGFPGDPPKPDGLAEWYRPHIAAWSERALPETTLSSTGLLCRAGSGAQRRPARAAESSRSAGPSRRHRMTSWSRDGGTWSRAAER